MTTGNGHNQYVVEETEKFRGQRDALEAEYPRLVDAFEAVKSQFRFRPQYQSRQFPGGATWLYCTREALGAPTVMIYFAIEDKRVTLRLAFLGESYDPPWHHPSR